MLTERQAKILCEAFEVFDMLNDDEEVEMLEENNPELLEAYQELYELAYEE